MSDSSYGRALPQPLITASPASCSQQRHPLNAAAFWRAERRDNRNDSDTGRALCYAYIGDNVTGQWRAAISENTMRRWRQLFKQQRKAARRQKRRGVAAAYQAAG